MHGNSGEIRNGASILPHPPDILGLVADCRESGRLLWDGISGVQWCDTGRPYVTHHIQCGGGFGGPALT